jgi:hypothetical protein
MIDVSLQAISITAAAPNEDDLKAGMPPEIQLAVTGGIFIPTQGNAIPIPGMRVKFNLDRDSALEIGKSLVEEGEKLPTHKIEVASNLSNVVDLAKVDKKLRKGDDIA